MTTELLELTPGSIGTNPGNPRTEVTNLTELADSIRAVGILEPLIVAPTGKASPKWVLIAGHRRLAAAKQAGLKTVPAIARHDLTDPAAQLEHALVENLHREDLTPVEEAKAYQALLEFPGYTVAKVVAATGRSKKTVQLRLGLTRLSEEVLDRVAGQQISLAEAEILARYVKEPDALKRLERAAGTSNFRFVVQSLADDKKRATTRTAALTQLEADGVAVVQGFSGNQALSWLGIEPTDHKDCPGHAASLSYDGHRITYVCTDPVANGHAPNDDTAQPFRGALGTSEHNEWAERRAALKTAETVRAKFIAGVVNQGDPAVLNTLARFLVDDVMSYNYATEALEALGYGVSPDQSYVEECKWAEEITAGWTYPQFIAFVTTEAMLSAGPVAHNQQPTDRAYMEALQALGYELCDVETTMVSGAESDPPADDE